MSIDSGRLAAAIGAVYHQTWDVTAIVAEYDALSSASPDRPPIYCTGGCDVCRDYARELGVSLIVPAPPRAPATATEPQNELNVKRLALAFDLNGVRWPKNWGDNDFAWLARQVGAEYRRLAEEERLTREAFG